jgi:hypothetical protein
VDGTPETAREWSVFLDWTRGARKKCIHCRFGKSFQHPRSPDRKNETAGLKAENRVNLVTDEKTAALPQAASLCALENYLALPDHSMDERIAQARARLGKSTVLLGHHYQRDEVVRFADFTGDSYKLSKAAAATEAEYIVSAVLASR